MLTIAFTTGVLLVESDDGRRASAPARLAGVAAFGLCLAIVGVGIGVMRTTK